MTPEIPLTNQETLLLRTPHFDLVHPVNNDCSVLFVVPTCSCLTFFLNTAATHNWYRFSHLATRPLPPDDPVIVPCLQIPYTPENLFLLTSKNSERPQKDRPTIPSIIRMERCLSEKVGRFGNPYQFSDNENNPLVSNPKTRHLMMLKATHKDAIPPKIIHSNSCDSYYKVRHCWWAGIIYDLDAGLETGEFIKNPNLINEINCFIRKYKSGAFIEPTHLTTRQDIQKANQLIDAIWQEYGNFPLSL